MIATAATQTLKTRETGVILTNKNFQQQSEPSGTNLGGLLDIAMEIAATRRDILTRMRNALLRLDDLEALNCARQLCGVAL